MADELRAAMGAFEQLVTTDAPSSIEALTKARVVLVQSVDGYIAHLGGCIGAASADVRMQRWREAHGRVLDLRRRYSEHIAQFSAATILTGWTAYRMSCRRLIATMREHLDQVARWEPLD